LVRRFKGTVGERLLRRALRSVSRVATGQTPVRKTIAIPVDDRCPRHSRS
jgi:hypothetical protein